MCVCLLYYYCYLTITIYLNLRLRPGRPAGQDPDRSTSFPSSGIPFVTGPEKGNRKKGALKSDLKVT